jgi:hypothetical protein
VATYGATLLELGVLTAAQPSGPTTGGRMVPDFGASPLAFLATALRVDEIAHVKYLRAALGSDYLFSGRKNYPSWAKAWEMGLEASRRQ